MTQEEFIRLSWKLLEAKVKYYLYPSLDNISDAEYDSLEKEYLKYCQETGSPNTVQSMVGVDQGRPSVRAAIVKVLK